MNRTQRLRIFKLAYDAVVASHDAHGYAVPAAMAYEFAKDNPEAFVEDGALMANEMPAEFVNDYHQLSRERTAEIENAKRLMYDQPKQGVSL